LQTSREIPSPHVGHAGTLVSGVFLIWGGDTNTGGQYASNEPQDVSLYLPDLGTLNLLTLLTPTDIVSCTLVSREWTRVVVNSPGPVGRYGHALTMIGSKFFIFGG
jgi:hypothetical protein